MKIVSYKRTNGKRIVSSRAQEIVPFDELSEIQQREVLENYWKDEDLSRLIYDAHTDALIEYFHTEVEGFAKQYLNPVGVEYNLRAIRNGYASHVCDVVNTVSDTFGDVTYEIRWAESPSVAADSNVVMWLGDMSDDSNGCYDDAIAETYGRLTGDTEGGYELAGIIMEIVESVEKFFKLISDEWENLMNIDADSTWVAEFLSTNQVKFIVFGGGACGSVVYEADF